MPVLRSFERDSAKFTTPEFIEYSSRRSFYIRLAARNKHSALSCYHFKVGLFRVFVQLVTCDNVSLVVFPQVTEQTVRMFHSMAGGVKIDGSVTPEYTLDLHKNSNDVRVVVSGLTDDERTRLRCTIGSANGDYGFDNEVRGVEGVCYLPAAGAEGADATNEFTVLRLWPGDASRLKVEVAAVGTTAAAGAGGTVTAAGSQVIFDGSLSELLLQKPGMDLDLQDDFVIKLEAQRKPGGGFGVEIYVNGWHVVDMPGGLG